MQIILKHYRCLKLHMTFWSCSEDVHVVSIYSLDYICLLVGKLSFVFFHALLLSKYINSGKLLLFYLLLDDYSFD